MPGKVYTHSICCGIATNLYKDRISQMTNLDVDPLRIAHLPSQKGNLALDALGPCLKGTLHHLPMEAQPRICNLVRLLRRMQCELQHYTGHGEAIDAIDRPPAFIIGITFLLCGNYS
jgi:hypothetical protein